MKEKELIELKEEIDETKTEISKLDGRKQAVLEQLLKDWGCKTIKEAKTLIEKKIKRKDILFKRANKLSKEIEQKYFE